MAALPSKEALREELLTQLTADLATIEGAHRATTAGAIHEEARAEDDKDTRAIEQSYLARGQAMRIEELRGAIAAVRAMPIAGLAEDDAIVLGALITVEEHGKSQVLFLAPDGGGKMLAGGRVQVVAPRSPLGRALIGKRAGDLCEATVGPRERSLDVVAVA